MLVKAGLLAGVPGDPYNGQPLQSKLPRGGMIIYSVGPDRVDDGGMVQRRIDHVAGQRNHPPRGTDQGFRLWDVPARGK